MATLKTRRIRVVVTNHALERFHERTGVKVSRKRIAKKVAARLQGKLRVGLRIDGTGSTWVPVGTEVIDTGGYIKIKIADPDKWEYKHRMIWEKTNGPIPDGLIVIFGDGDKTNFNVDNLLLVTRAQLARLNQRKLIQNDVNLTKVGVIIADIYNKIGSLEKGGKQ